MKQNIWFCKKLNIIDNNITSNPEPQASSPERFQKSDVRFMNDDSFWTGFYLC